ncbi:hypothetical protein [Capnocytophaga bilenii]
MFNFYLATIGYENASVAELEEHFKTLNVIHSAQREEEVFLKSDAFWDIKTLDDIYIVEAIEKFSEGQFVGTTYGLLEQISPIQNFRTLDEIDTHYPQKNNAFWGAQFEITDERHINSEEKYHSFKKQKIRNITKGIEIWERRSLLFKRVELCSGVEAQLKSVGYTGQILEKLLILDEYCQTNWLKGCFSYMNANGQVALNISLESVSTMNDPRKKQMRMFKLPNGKTECFELHIKTGDLRFHFFPDNNSLKIYIGYIGAHLPI